MPGLTVGDVFARVKRTFGDESGVQVTEDDIIRYINDAQREAVMQNEGLLPSISYIDLVAGQTEYDYPDNTFSVYHVYCKSDTNNQFYKLRWLSVFEMSVFNDGWHGDPRSSFPLVYTREIPRKIILFPIPPSSVTGGLKLHTARFANPVSNSTDQLEVPEWLHTMVVNFCLSQSYEMDEDWEAAQIKSQQVQGDLNFNSDRDAWFGRDTYPVISERFEAWDYYE